MTEQELHRIHYLNQELEHLEEELNEMKNKSMVKGPQLSGMPYGSGFSDKTADYAVRIHEIQRLIGMTIDRILKTRADLERFFQGIEDPELRMILRLRSIEHLGWQEIGDELGMDRRTAARKYQKFCKEKFAHNAHAKDVTMVSHQKGNTSSINKGE